MSIIYSLIARGAVDNKHEDTILVDYTQASGNFTQFAKEVMKKQQKNTKLSLIWDKDYTFHYLNENNYTYLCLTKSPFSTRASFAFLEDIKNEFNAQISQEKRDKAVTYHGLNTEFCEVMKKQMKYFNSNQVSQKLTTLNKNINQVVLDLQSNIEPLIDRENKIQLLIAPKKQYVQISDRQIEEENNKKLKSFLIICFILGFIYLVFFE